jgi:hypothetical protein
MNVLRRYLIVVVAGVSLLLGIQVPNFLDQYEKRVDAHLSEVTSNLHHYQAIADRYHEGSLYALIAFHKANPIKTFQEEGLVIANMHKRKAHFVTDLQALQGGGLWNVLHVVMAGDQELIKETAARYSYAIPLNQDAVIAGVFVAAVNVLLLEMLLGLLASLARLLRPRSLQSTQMVVNTIQSQGQRV